VRIIGTTLLLTVCCAVGLAQASAAQRTENPAKAKESAVTPQTEARTLPEKRLTVLDVTQIQIGLSEAFRQQNDSRSMSYEKLRAQGIEPLPNTRMVIKDGAIYLVLGNETLVPMNGGGASGCVPDNPKNVGKLISIPSQTDGQQAPGKDPVKNN
jgi:hypothetical protein